MVEPGAGRRRRADPAGDPGVARCLEILAGGETAAGRLAAGMRGGDRRARAGRLRFARPDGSPVMHRRGHPTGIPSGLGLPRTGCDWYRGTGIAKVLGWWSGAGSRAAESGSPSPAHLVRGGSGAGDAPTRLAARRRFPGRRPPRRRDRPAGWSSSAAGRTWLGPDWGEGVNGPAGPASRPRPSRWLTGAAADLIEWSYRADGLRITRSALLLRGRRLALLSILAERRGPTWDVEPTLRLTMPRGRRGRPAQGIAGAGARPSRGVAARRTPCRSPCPASPIPPTAGRSGPRIASSS